MRGEALWEQWERWILLASLVFFGISLWINSVPVIGWIAGLLLMPAWGIFSARFITRVYESGE